MLDARDVLLCGLRGASRGSGVRRHVGVGDGSLRASRRASLLEGRSGGTRRG